MDLVKLCVMIALIILLLILLVVEFAVGPWIRSTALPTPLPTPGPQRPQDVQSGESPLATPAAGETPSDNRVTLVGAGLPAGVLTLVGAGAPNAEIEIVDNGQIVGTARVDADGQWRFAYAPGSGDHELLARVKGEPGTASSTFKVMITTPAPLGPSGERCVGPTGRIVGNIYVVGVCDTLTQISRRTGISVKALIAANPQITDTNRIYVGQAVWLPR